MEAFIDTLPIVCNGFKTKENKGQPFNNSFSLSSLLYCSLFCIFLLRQCIAESLKQSLSNEGFHSYSAQSYCRNLL